MVANPVQVVADRIVAYLSEKQHALGAAQFLELEISGMRLLLDPSPDDLPTEAHRATLHYWRGLSAVEGIPDQVKVEPDRLQAALGYLMLVDVVGGPAAYRYALYGTKIANIAGFDMTGKSVWEAATNDEIRLFFAAVYQAAIVLRQPVFSVHEAPPSITTSEWNRLILPLGEAGVIKRFLVCNVPMQEGAPVGA